MRHIAIIPARSGSKGLRDKNIKELAGKPLLQYSIEAAQKSGLFSCVHVSTDSASYAQIAQKAGAEVPFLRKPDLSGDQAGTWDVLRFVIRQYEKLGQTFDTVTLLQPTSPLRNAQDIQNAFAIFQEKQADSVISVCEVEHSPLLCNTIGEDGSMCGFLNMQKVGRRQDLGAYYRINGAIYIQKTERLMQNADLYGEKSYCYRMPKERSIDIDDAFDFRLAEFWMRSRSMQSSRRRGQ